MSHVRPEDKTPRARRSDCRNGRHTYGESQGIGAGLLRRVCELCSAVTIDLTNADELTTPLPPPQPNILSLTAQQSEAS